MTVFTEDRDEYTAIEDKFYRQYVSGEEAPDEDLVEDIMTAAGFLLDCDRGSREKFLEALRKRLELAFWEYEGTIKDLQEQVNDSDFCECEARRELEEVRNELKKAQDKLKKAHVKLKEARK